MAALAGETEKTFFKHFVTVDGKNVKSNAVCVSIEFVIRNNFFKVKKERRKKEKKSENISRVADRASGSKKIEIILSVLKVSVKIDTFVLASGKFRGLL